MLAPPLGVENARPRRQQIREGDDTESHRRAMARHCPHHLVREDDLEWKR